MPWSNELIYALDQVGKNYLKYSIGKPKNNVKSRVYRKIYRSLEFYRKSHRITDDMGESTVYLAIAFEILLTDNFSFGGSERIYDRVSILLKGFKGNRKLIAAVRGLYEARNKYVHAGEISDTLCLKTARAAFINSFLSMFPRLNTLTNNSDLPIKQIVEIK